MAENLTFRLDVDSSHAVSSINQFFQTFEQGAAKAKGVLNKEFGQGVKTDIKIEFKNGALVASEIQSARQESNRLGAAWNAINGKIGQTPNELKRQQQVIKALINDTTKYKNGTKQVTAEWRELQNRLNSVNAAMRNMTGGNFLSGFAGRFAAVQTAANLATGAIMGVFRGIQDLAGTAVRMEALQLQLAAFTGSASSARDAFDQFVNIAANSPLNLEQVAGAGKIMMAFGVETDEAVKATEQLAVVSAATGGDINLLSRNLGQIVAQGRAYTRDLTQFAIQGVPIWEQLSIVTGHSTTALKTMATEGKIGFREVQQALANMTAEGSAFNKVAEGMQETFQGRLARIEAGFQKMALEAVNSFNNLDQALGGLMSGSMSLFADAVFAIADNFDAITIAIASATAATVAFFTVQNWGLIIGFIKTAVATVIALGNAKRIAAIAAAALQALMGNWGAIAAGVAAATVTAVALGAAFDNSKTQAEGATNAVNDYSQSLGELSQAELELAGRNHNYRVEAYKNARDAADEYRTVLDAELLKLEEMKAFIKGKYEEEKLLLQDTLADLRVKLQAEKDGLAEAKEDIKARYDEEKTQLREVLGEIRNRYSEELSALDEMGPKQQALYDFEKRKLQESIKSGQLDKEALLRAQARLEKMERQEQAAKLRKQQAEEEKPILKALEQSEKDRKTAVEEVTRKYEDRIQAIEKEKGKVEQQIRDAEEAYRAEIAAIDDAIKAANNLETAIDTGTNAVEKQILIVKDLTAQWKEAETAARNAAAAIRSANAAAASSSDDGGDNRASGGPVSGGTSYTVNEFGKEAFLSASGRLSMINAPSWGQWRAPGAGTVIPAHLTKQLAIPSGGVDLNQAASAASARAGASGSNLKGLVNAISGSLRGDTFNQSVTVQAANPVQAANNIMVEMTRLKRRRLG